MKDFQNLFIGKAFDILFILAIIYNNIIYFLFINKNNNTKSKSI